MIELGLRESKRLRTWRRLRSVALELMAVRGFDDVGIDEIASAAGVSRATFFNYFESKDALVFDTDPDDAGLWRALFETRPVGETLWTSVGEVILAFGAATGVELELQMKLKKGSPRLASSSRESRTQFWTELGGWVAERAGLAGLHTGLVMNAALAVLSSAFERWSPDEGIARFLDDATTGFRVLGAGLDAGTTRPLPPPG